MINRFDKQYFSKVFIPGIFILFVSYLLVNGSSELESSSASLVLDIPDVQVGQIQDKNEINEEFSNVIKVIDGDTLNVLLDGKSEIIRLIGVNTPEVVDPRKPVECFGIEASNKAKDLLAGQKIIIETDSSQGGRDKYGRLLAYVFLPDSTSFNEYMIRDGYAYEYTYNLPYKYQAEYKAAQKYAEDNEQGLWAPGVCDSWPYDGYNSPEVSSVQLDFGKYTCSYNAYDCADFKNHNEAQAVYEGCGGVRHDIHFLDGDRDELACESLP